MVSKSIPPGAGASSVAPFAPGKAIADVSGEYIAYDTIQEALDNTDGLVTIGPGTYNENLQADRAIDLVVIGSGRATVIDGTNAADDTFDLKGSLASFTLRDFAIQNDRFQGGGQEGIKIDGVSEGLLQNLFIEQADRYGIQVLNAFDVTVNNCTFNGSDVYCVDISSGSDDISVTNSKFRTGDANRLVSIGNNCERCHVSDNLMEDGGQEDSIVTQGAGTVISNNTIDLVAVDAIDVQSNAVGSTVQGNVIQDPGADGIDVQADDVSVVGNTVRGAGSDSYVIRADNCTLTGNTSDTPSGEHYALWDATNLKYEGNAPTPQGGIEDFERDGWLDDYVGDKTAVGTTHESVFKDRALQFGDVASADATVLYDTPGDRTVVSGNIYEYYVYVNNDGGGEAFSTHHYFASGTGFGTLNAYQLQVAVGTTTSLSLQRVDAGIEAALTSTTIGSLEPDTWYIVRYQPVAGGTHRANIRELSSDAAALGSISYDTSGDGTQYTSGTFGFGNDNADYVNVSRLAQTDAL